MPGYAIYTIPADVAFMQWEPPAPIRTRPEVRALLDACRIPKGAIATGTHGPWRIEYAEDLAWNARRWFAHGGIDAIHDRLRYLGPYTSMTMLHRLDHVAPAPSGHLDPECVMEDSDRELRRHLPILLAARGRVLVSGLGLGCVVRGLLSKHHGPLSEPTVTHIDVLEIDPHIIEVCGAQFADEPRVTIHFGDARWRRWPSWQCWDYAWHDIWAPNGDSLHVEHMRLAVEYHERVRHWQGAWQMPREAKRKVAVPMLGLRRRQLLAMRHSNKER